MKRRLDFEGLEGRRLLTGATQIAGVGEFAGEGECTAPPDAPDGTAYVFALEMDGSLDGCLYTYVDEDSVELTPSGVYRETGVEIYVGSGGTDDDGTFETTYRFTAKYEVDKQGELILDDNGFPIEISGRCQHPITAGMGTGDFEGVTGRIDFKDDIEAGDFPFRGHLRGLA